MKGTARLYMARPEASKKAKMSLLRPYLCSNHTCRNVSAGWVIHQGLVIRFPRHPITVICASAVIEEKIGSRDDECAEMRDMKEKKVIGTTQRIDGLAPRHLLDLGP